MEKKKTKRNVLKIINDATYVLGDNWGEMIAATALALVGVVAWIFFPLFGFVLMAFATGFISLGYIKFTILTLNNKNPNIEVIYSSFNKSLQAFALRVVMCVLTALWSFLLIIPGVICALNFAFAMSVMTEEKNITVFKAIDKSKQLVNGYRLEILDIYLLWFLMLIIVFGGTLALFVGISFAIPSMPLWLIFTLAGICTLLSEILIFMPFKQVCLTSIYLNAKENYKSSQKISNKTTQTVEDVA